MSADAGRAPESDLAVFDARILCEMFGAESAVVAAVLQVFLTSMADSMRELQAADAARDRVAAAAVAHRIKGSAAMSGALALARVAAGVEDLARGGEWLPMRTLMAEVETQWLKLQRDPGLLHVAGIAP